LEQPGFMNNSFRADTGYGVLDSISFSSGRHCFKAGFDVRFNQQNRRQSPAGSFNFNARATAIPNEAFSGNQTGYSFASYLLGIVDSASWSDPVTLGGRRRYWSVYFQDDFKVSSRLTLNLGLRWEYQPPFFEVADRLSSWNPQKIDPETKRPGAYDFAGDCNICTGKRYFGKRSLDFGPRAGFAWRVRDKWTVRGAYGILYEGDPPNGYSGIPIGKALSVAWGGTYSLSADPVRPWAGIFNWDDGFPASRFQPASFDLSWGNRNRPAMVDPNYGLSPYIQNFNLNVQRELPSRFVLDVGYVGNKATRLRIGELQRINQLPPALLAQQGNRLNNAVRSEADARANGIAYPFSGFAGTVASALRQYPQIQGNQTLNVFGSPLGFSSFHSLQVVLNREFAQGLTLYSNYTRSKTLTNLESSLIGDNPDRPLDYYNLRLEKSVAEFDVPHTFKTYASYDLPFFRRNRILGGWQLAAILNYASGQPLAFPGSFPLSGGWNGATNRANIAAGAMKVAGFDESRFELSNLRAPQNSYLNKALYSDPAPLTLGTAARRYSQARGFGNVSENLTLTKSHPLTETIHFQLRAEFLNAFNRHSLGGIVTSVTNPNFGQVTSVSGFRQIQVSARLDF
ncbi:MAG: TonB-dependent receptor domain-containing protein, partial [Bryobacteraceae bacterium]